MTDDIQVLPETPSEVAPEENKEATPPVEETPAPTDDKPAEVKPERTFTQVELDDILQRRLAKEQRKIEKYARAEAENQVLRQQLDTRQPPQTQSGGEPKPEQFDTYEKYIDAVTDFKVDQKLKSEQQKYAQQQQVNQEQVRVNKVRDALAPAIAKYDDFDEVVIDNKTLAITPAMMEAIGETDIGGEVAYYLGKNPAEAEKIAQLSRINQIRAIDKLSEKLRVPPPVSKAPKPMETVGSGKTVTVDLQTANMDDYLAQRRKQGARYFK